jgi:hypothetical protein
MKGKVQQSEAQMSDVNTENTKQQSGWTSAAILAGTAVAAIYVLPVVLPVVFGHLLLAGAAAAGAGAYVATNEGRREKAKSFFSFVGKAYKDAFSNAFHGFRKAEKWAEAKEAARKAAPEADAGASPLASKQAGAEFNASSNGAKVTVTANENKPAPKPTSLGM